MHFCIHTGVQFWKQPSWKFFAVPEDLMVPVRTKRHYSSKSRDDDNDDDFETVVRRERKEANCTCTDKLQEVLGSLQHKVNLVLTLTPETKLLLGLKKLLMDSFSCKTFKELPIEPPIIFSKYCRAIVGCETCVNCWYSGEDAMTKMCPHCQAERGYAERVRLVGLDDFLQGIKNLVSEDATSNRAESFFSLTCIIYNIKPSKSK